MTFKFLESFKFWETIIICLVLFFGGMLLGSMPENTRPFLLLVLAAFAISIFLSLTNLVEATAPLPNLSLEVQSQYLVPPLLAFALGVGVDLGLKGIGMMIAMSADGFLIAIILYAEVCLEKYKIVEN